MSPMHKAVSRKIRIKLKKQMIFAFEKNKTARITQPTFFS